ncbi:hypothetical protein NL676_019392 [Syzygium grande]|nr:hypothetical protein NL676_019392 [Syzygium grande]
MTHYGSQRLMFLLLLAALGVTGLAERTRTFVTLVPVHDRDNRWLGRGDLKLWIGDRAKTSFSKIEVQRSSLNVLDNAMIVPATSRPGIFQAQIAVAISNGGMGKCCLRVSPIISHESSLTGREQPLPVGKAAGERMTHYGLGLRPSLSPYPQPPPPPLEVAASSRGLATLNLRGRNLGFEARRHGAMEALDVLLEQWKRTGFSAAEVFSMLTKMVI